MVRLHPARSDSIGTSNAVLCISFWVTSLAPKILRMQRGNLVTTELTKALIDAKSWALHQRAKMLRILL
jgi:hypothetical protein